MPEICLGPEFGSDLKDTIGYICHHLQIAGCNAEPLFTDDAITSIFDYTKGVPRQINRICTNALMAGMIEHKTVLEESIIRKAIAELDVWLSVLSFTSTRTNDDIIIMVSRVVMEVKLCLHSATFLGPFIV